MARRRTAEFMMSVFVAIFSIARLVLASETRTRGNTYSGGAAVLTNFSSSTIIGASSEGLPA